MTKFQFLVMVLAAAVVSPPPVALTQESPANNAALLKQYFAPKSVTRLEWELMDFNVSWQGAFVGSTDYITSFPVGFDPKAVRFRASFRVSEQRYNNDPEPFFRLPRPRREAVLQSGIAHLKEMLGLRFPEIKSNPSLLYVEFNFRVSGGGSSTVAKYENGTLILSE